MAFGPFSLFTLLGSIGYAIHDEAKKNARNAKIDAEYFAHTNGNDLERDKIQTHLVFQYYYQDDHGEWYIHKARQEGKNMGYYRAQTVRRLMKEKGLPVNESLLDSQCGHGL